MQPITRPIIFGLTTGCRVNSSVNQISRYKLFAYCTRDHTNQANDGQKENETKRDPRARLAGKIKAVQGKARPFALPNLISGSRLALAPATNYFIMNGHYSYATACIATAWATDIADKTVAWLMKHQTRTRVALDFVADKAFLFSSMICLAKLGYVPFWMMKGLAIREVSFICGAITYRYLSIREPSIGKLVDFHNYPMFGFDPSNLSRMYTTSLYALFTYYMYQASLQLGETTYGWGLFSCEIGVAVLGTLSWAHVYNNLRVPKFESIPAKQ